MIRWVMLASLFGGATALAADSDGDGCDDARLTADAACVHPTAVVAADVLLGTDAVVGRWVQIGAGTTIGDGAIIADYANIAGRNMAGEPSVIGALAVVGRRVQLGSGAVVGAQATVGRSVTAGTDLQVGAGAWIGYGSILGDDVVLGDNAVVGSLASVGSMSTIGPSAVLSRGVVVSAGLADDAPTVVNGVVGPEVRVGGSAFIDRTARVRKQSVIGEGARILANARVGRRTEIGARAVVSDASVVRANSSVCNDTTVPADTYIARLMEYPGAECPCEPGYARVATGDVCEDIDECAEDSADCGGFTECANTDGAFVCDCVLGYVANIDGECVPVDAEVIGDFGPNLSNQSPNGTLDSPETVTVDGFEGTLEVDVQTTGSGAAAVVQALRDGSWQTVTSILPGDELRVRAVAPPGTGQSRTVTVTLFVGPTNVWTSPTWALSTWTYSASGVSYGSCSASCGGGSQSPISWTCNRSDGTSGHSSGNCSAGGSRSCNTQSCPFPSGGQVYPSGDRTRINDPNTNSPRYEIQCRNGGNGGSSTYTVVSPASTSVNSSQREVTIFLYNGGTTRRGYVRFRFNATSSGLRVSSFQPGAGTHHGYLCYNPSFNESACNPRASIIDPNCSSRIFCRMRDLWTGSTIWSNSLNQTRALPCNGYGGGPFPPAWNGW